LITGNHRPPITLAVDLDDLNADELRLEVLELRDFATGLCELVSSIINRPASAHMRQ
jgi:hypothetical protein